MRFKADRIIKDKNGRVVLWQSPNLLLASWIVLKLIGLVVSAGRFKTGLEDLSTAVLFAWAYLEATKGVDYFRKLLGAVILAYIAVSFFL